MIEPSKYRVRGYAEFRQRAIDSSLTLTEKCGIAEEFRAGYEPRILQDISSKLTNFKNNGARICDIGAGCSELSQLIHRDHRAKLPILNGHRQPRNVGTFALAPAFKKN